MPLTSNQKHYIKKNLYKLSVGEISRDLNLGEKEIRKYARKKLGDARYGRLFEKESSQAGAEKAKTFSFGNFFVDNLNYFLLLFFLVSICYLNSLGNGFVSDDIPAILNNKDMGNLSSAFNTFLIGWPRNVLYYLIFKLTGANPLLFRSINIIFHLGSVFLFFVILNVLSTKRIAIMASVIFAVHPILVESVSWISGGTYPQYSFFLLFSFLGYLVFAQRKNYIAVLLFILAILSSEKAVIFPLMLILFEMIRGQLKNNFKKLVPYLLTASAATSFLLLKLNPKMSALEQLNYDADKGSYNPFLQIPVAIGSYLKLILWPQKLSLYQTEMMFSPFQYMIFILVIMLFLALIFYGWKKNKALFFWLSFFFISLLPTLTPFKIAWVVAERYVYLGSLGLFVSAAMFFDWLAKKAGEKSESYQYAVYSIFAIFIIALSARTIVRNLDWKNEDTLWIATAKVSPSGQSIHNNLGDVYSRQGNLEKAAEEFKIAIGINPNYADAYHNLGNTYKFMGKLDLAIENYEKALSINPNIWQSHQNLAAIYYDQGDFQKAEEHLKKAIKINPNNPDLQENLSIIQSSVKK